jgi:hypothetical protein
MTPETGVSTSKTKQSKTQKRMTKQKNPTVNIRGEEIEISELRWKDASQAVKGLIGSLARMVGADGAISFDQSRITASIAEQEELLSFVVQKSTGRDSQWIDDLTGAEALRLLGPIVELNLNPETITVGKSIFEKVSRFLVAKKSDK